MTSGARRMALKESRRTRRRGGRSLVEDQVERREDASTRRELRTPRDAIGNAGVSDLPLRAHEALGERRFGHEKRARDIRRREAAESVERQGDPGVEGERGVRAGEDEPETVVRELLVSAAGVDRVHGLLALQERGLAREDPLAAQPVERLVPGGPDDPRARARGHALDGPAFGRDGEGLLHGFLGGSKPRRAG